MRRIVLIQLTEERKESTSKLLSAFIIYSRTNDEGIIILKPFSLSAFLYFDYESIVRMSLVVGCAIKCKFPYTEREKELRI